MEKKVLKELYKEEVENLYGAETQLVAALAEMVKAARSEDLRAAFHEHLEQTREHVSRLKEIFEGLDGTPTARKCKGMEGLIEEIHKTIAQKAYSEAMDAGLIAAAQRVEHYEIASYGCARTYARLLGHGDGISLLELTLDEEKESDGKLAEVAAEIFGLSSFRFGSKEIDSRKPFRKNRAKPRRVEPAHRQPKQSVNLDGPISRSCSLYDLSKDTAQAKRSIDALESFSPFLGSQL